MSDGRNSIIREGLYVLDGAGMLMEMQFVKMQNAERREDTFGAKNGTKETKKNSVWHTLSLSTNIHVEMLRKGKECVLKFR